MSKKETIAPGTLVAAANIAIDGKHFARGAEIKGVDEEQLRVVRSSRRVVTHAELMNRGSPVASESGLRSDGPTILQFIAAGYDPAHYPPEGFASASSEEEIATAVALIAAAKPAEPEGGKDGASEKPSKPNTPAASSPTNSGSTSEA